MAAGVGIQQMSEASTPRCPMTVITADYTAILFRIRM